MATPTYIYVIQGDKLYDLNFTLKDSTGVAIDLTGNSSITLEVQDPQSSSLKFSGTMSVVSATAGTCRYSVQSSDFNLPGQYNAEIRVDYTGGKRISFGDIIIVVQPTLPK